MKKLQMPNPLLWLMYPIDNARVAGIVKSIPRSVVGYMPTAHNHTKAERADHIDELAAGGLKNIRMLVGYLGADVRTYHECNTNGPVGAGWDGPIRFTSQQAEKDHPVAAHAMRKLRAIERRHAPQISQRPGKLRTAIDKARVPRLFMSIPMDILGYAHTEDQVLGVYELEDIVFSDEKFQKKAAIIARALEQDIDAYEANVPQESEDVRAMTRDAVTAYRKLKVIALRYGEKA